MPWYQTAERAPASWLILKTWGYLGLVWAIGLYLVPRLIVTWQVAMELHQLFFEPQQALALSLIGVATLVSFWSAMLLAVKGRGTPARLDAPRRLVIEGPYAWVRNPMAVCGFAQGIAVALYTGSTMIVIILLLVACFWHFVRRRDEEHDLQRVFGRDYELYRRSVRCWLPRRRRWAPAEPEAAIAARTVGISSGRRRHRRH